MLNRLWNWHIFSYNILHTKKGALKGPTKFVLLSGGPSGGSGRGAKFLLESNTFHIRSKTIKMLSCRNFAPLLDPLLDMVNNIY